MLFRSTVMLPGGTEAYGAGEIGGLVSSLFPDVGNIAPLVAKGIGALTAKGLGGLALAGAIQPRGLPNLLAVHNLTGGIDQAIDLLTKRKSISSPSIAISERVNPFETSPTILFNPE